MVVLINLVIVNIMTLADPFHFEACCFNKATNTQTLIARYYESIEKYMNDLLYSIYQAELFGKPTEQLYNIGNDFHYLLTILLIINEESKNDAEWQYTYGNGCYVDNGIDYYIEKYNINCIAKHFSCIGTGYDISGALEVFGMNPNDKNQDGIGYMHISFSENSKCNESRKAFIVR